MVVEVARLAAGRVSLNPNRSINTTAIGQIYTDSKPDIRAVVKALSARQIANELLASSLLAELGLPSPRSYLVFADPEDAFGTSPCQHESGYLIYFGSELSPLPTFYTFFNMQSDIAISAVTKYDGWGNVIGFDEWIANTDRHLNNFLFDGSKVLMFDHDRCLTGPGWSPPDLVPDRVYPCHQAIDVIHSQMPEARRQQAARLAYQIATRAENIDLERVLSNSLAFEVNHDVPQDLPAAIFFFVSAYLILPAYALAGFQREA